eukprot:5458126-Pyramimonas_sp.AAC.1
MGRWGMAVVMTMVMMTMMTMVTYSAGTDEFGDDANADDGAKMTMGLEELQISHPTIPRHADYPSPSFAPA